MAGDFEKTRFVVPRSQVPPGEWDPATMTVTETDGSTALP